MPAGAFHARIWAWRYKPSRGPPVVTVRQKCYSCVGCLESLRQGVDRPLDRAQFLVSESLEKTGDEINPTLPPTLHDPPALVRRAHEGRSTVSRVWVPRSQLRAFESVDYPGHGRAGDLLSFGQSSDCPVTAKDEDRQRGELSPRDAEGGVCGTSTSNEVDRQGVEPRCEDGEYSGLH